MKKTKSLIVAALFAVAVALPLTGCVTANPQHATDPTAPAFVPDTGSISNAAFVAKQISAAIPGNPYTFPINLGIDTAASLALAGSVFVAWLRSRNKNKTLGTILDATTQVIENAGADVAPDLKQRVKQLTTVAGVEAELNKRLN